LRRRPPPQASCLGVLSFAGQAGIRDDFAFCLNVFLGP
jgi:hypothetical protein